MKNLRNFVMLVLFTAGFFTQSTIAQVTVTGSTGADGNYTSLTNAGGAFAAINATAQTGNNIVVTLTGNSTAEAGTNALNAGAWTTLKIYPTASGLTISGNVGGPLINLNGADNVTIDGRVNASGTSKDLTISNATTGMGSTIQFISSAENNTVKYCTIKGSGTTSGTGVIFFSNSAAGNGNDGNTIDNNNITGSASGRPGSAIYSYGTSSRENSGNTISNNLIYDFFNPGSNSYGIFISSNTIAWTISGNSFYETASFVPSTDIDFIAIRINNTSGTGFTVSGNFIGGRSASCGGTAWTKTSTKNNAFIAIYMNVGTGAASNVQNNVIRNFAWSNSGAAAWTGIHVEAGMVNIGTVAGNTIGSATGTGSVTVTGGLSGTNVIGINFGNTNGTVDCQNNYIGSMTTATSNPAFACNLFGINKTISGGTTTIRYNTIGSITTSNSLNGSSESTGNPQNVIGINTQCTGTISIENNTIANLTNGTTSANAATAGYIHGISSGSAIYTISNNIIHDLTIANANNNSNNFASVCGIALNSTTLKTITGNTIYNLSNTNTSFTGCVIGLYFTGNTSTNVVSGNFIHSLSVSGASNAASLYGIRISAGAATYSNNIISLGGNTSTAIYGIYETGAANNNNNLYFNTVFIGGEPATGSLNSYALYSAVTTNIRNFRNNIFVNARSNNGASGKHYAAYFDYAVNTSLTLDYNDYYAPGTGGELGFYNSVDRHYLPLIEGMDAGSLAIDPIFATSGGTTALDYKPSSDDLIGNTIGTITTDYAGTTRKDPPTMGAYEGTLDLYVDVYISGVFQATYFTLKKAFDKINDGTYTGVIELRIKGNPTETATAALYQSGYTGAGGTSSYTAVTIYPTVTGITITGNLSLPMIDLNGADNVTIDGRVNATGFATDMTIINANASGSTIRFIESAENNTIKYCTVKGTTNSNLAGVIFFTTTTSGNGNDGNTIDHCNLTNAGDIRPYNLVYSAGTSGRENSGMTISNNNFYDFFRTGTNSAGVSIAGFSTDWTISGNSFYETDTVVPTQHNDYRHISINNTSGNNFIISGNYFGGQLPLCKGNAFAIEALPGTSWHVSYQAIYLSVGAASPTSVQGNLISNIGLSNSLNPNPFYGIYINAGTVNVGTINGNTIGATTGTGSINIASSNAAGTLTSRGIYAAGSGAVTISGNSIGSVTTSNTVSGSQYKHDFYGIELSSTGSKTITNNLIGSKTEPMSIQTFSESTGQPQQLFGVFGSGNASYTITGNTISNLHNNATTTTSTAQTIGIMLSEGTITIQNNMIRNLSNNSGQTGINSSASVIGIYRQTPRSGAHLISGNTICNLSNTYPATAAVHVYGCFLGTASGTPSISGNLIHSLGIDPSNSSTSALINGIRLYAGNNATFNNIVALSDVPNDCMIYGIYENGGMSNNNTIYFNTVYIGGTISSGSVNTTAIFGNDNGNTRNYRDNIFMNTRTGGSGNHYAIYLNYASAGSTWIMDYNDYFASGTYWGYFNSTNYNNIATWRTAVGGGRDANSMTADPGFFNPGGTFADDYYPSTVLNGITIAGYTTDYLGIARATPPEMGALERLILLTWTGATNSDWNTATNWSPNLVPHQSCNVTIPDVTNDPVVNDVDMKCYRLIIHNDATLTINPGKSLVAYGNFTVSTAKSLIIKSDESGKGNFSEK